MAFHASPSDSAGRTRCCNRDPSELADDDQITNNTDNVTCLGKQRTKGKPRTPCAHWIAGTWINCCEQGETDCPCACHEEPTS